MRDNMCLPDYTNSLAGFVVATYPKNIFKTLEYSWGINLNVII